MPLLCYCLGGGGSDKEEQRTEWQHTLVFALSRNHRHEQHLQNLSISKSYNVKLSADLVPWKHNACHQDSIQSLDYLDTWLR